jgi:hypothetical protein
MVLCRPVPADRAFCNHLQNVGATTYKNVLQLPAKKACKKHSAEYLITGNIEGKLVENSEEQQLLNYYRKLNAEKRKAVLQNIKWLAE